MKRIILATTLATLVGCAYTLEDVTAEAPEFTAQTQKLPAAYAECLQNGWLDYGPTFTKPTAGGYRVFTNYGGAVGTAADAINEGGRTTVHFYNPNRLTQKKFREAAEACL